MSIFLLIRYILGAMLLLFGVFVFIAEVIGVFKFRYVLNRMHAAAMGDTLGIGSCFLGLILISGLTFTTCKMILVVVFLWFSSPTASHLIAKMEVESEDRVGGEFEEKDLDKKEE